MHFTISIITEKRVALSRNAGHMFSRLLYNYNENFYQFMLTTINFTTFFGIRLPYSDYLIEHICRNVISAYACRSSNVKSAYMRVKSPKRITIQFT